MTDGCPDDDTAQCERAEQRRDQGGRYVVHACTLIWICTGPPLGPDIHANSDGYGVIAETFAAVLGV